MNAEDLRFFLAVREAGSMKGAARALRVDHSTVSRRVAALEQALDARLFERTPDGLVETDVARAIAPLAERIALLTRDLEDAASAASGSPNGPVRIAVSPVMAEHFLLPRIPELRQRFPDVHFEVVADVAPVSILRREADIALRLRPEGQAPAEATALATRVGRFGYALYASEDYVARRGRPARPVRNLAGHEMIRSVNPGPGEAWNVQLDEPASYAMSAYPMFAVSSAARAGVGVAVLPCIEADADPRFVRLSEVLGVQALWIVTSPEVRNNARVAAVKDALLEMTRTLAARLEGTAEAPVETT